MNEELLGALAECDNDDLNARTGVRELTSRDIYDWAKDDAGLTAPSAKAFSGWMCVVWYDFNEDCDLTNRQVLEGALAEWCGGRS